MANPFVMQNSDSFRKNKFENDASIKVIYMLPRG